jgi:hypothetical protein
MRALIVLFTLLLPCIAKAEDSVVGVWKLVSVMYEDQETKQMTPVLGDARAATRSPPRKADGRARHRKRPAGAEDR